MRCGVEKINHSCAFSSSVSKPRPPKKNKPRPISARSKYRETTFGAPKRSRESHCFTTLRRILLFFFYPFLVAFNVVGRPRNKSPDKVLATETPSINVTSPRGKLPRINDCVFSRFVYTFHVRRTSQALPRKRRHIQSCRGTSIDAFRPIRIKTSTALWFFLILQRESYTKLGYKAPLVSCSRSGTLRRR